MQDPRKRGCGSLASLSDELLHKLMLLMDARTLVTLASTSKLWRVLASEEPLWLELTLSAYRRPFAYRGSWRATYASLAAGREVVLSPPAPVPGFSSEFLYRRWFRCNIDLSGFEPPVSSGVATTIPHLADAAGMSPEQFDERFDVPCQPVLLGGLTASPGWQPAAWQPQALGARLGGVLVKVTKPGAAGGRMRMRLADYLAYAAVQRDEEPLYVFDSEFAETLPQLLSAYSVPPLFRHDLFDCLGHLREEYRWLIVGPARSGASWHVDPSATSAWNTLLAGRKRWALYPPGRVPPGVYCSITDDGQPDFQGPTSLQWFLEVYPHLPPEQRPLEVLQQAGDTIFIPCGWWHCVLNLDLTVAVTQNFVSPANLEAAVAYQSLGAGALVDPHLVPAFLQRQREDREEQEWKQERERGQEQKQGAAAGDSEEPPADPGLQAARQHLDQLATGFASPGALGPWLRRLWEQRADLRPRVLELAERYTDVQEWEGRLGQAAAAAGLPPPQRHEALPLAGGECVVFEVGGGILKFFDPGSLPQAAVMCQIEAVAYRSLSCAGQSRSTSGTAAVPRLLASGLLQGGEGASAGAGTRDGDGDGADADTAPPLPYLAVTKAPGTALGACAGQLSLERWSLVGAAVGRSLAALHSAPLPGSSSRSSSRACTTAWIARDGILFSSQHGTCDLRPRDQAAVRLQLFACAELPSGAQQEACAACAAWQPFVSFLRRQWRNAPGYHSDAGTLPPQLLGALPDYLGPDPAALLGCCACLQGCGSQQAGVGGTNTNPTGCACASSIACAQAPPTWCHGDLTALNLLLGDGLLDAAPASGDCAAGNAGVALIDYGDSGQGDPLFDLPPLFVRSFEGRQPVGQACLQAYSTAPHPRWPCRPPGVQLSRVATCYTLVNELELMSSVFKRWPELWEAKTLDEVQVAVWGWLDVAAEQL